MAAKDRNRSPRDLTDTEEDSATGSTDSSGSEEESASDGQQTDSDASGKVSAWDGSKATSRTAEEQAEAEESDSIGDQVLDLRERLGLDRGRKIIGADYSDEIEELGNKMIVAEHKGIELKDAGKITSDEIVEFIKEQRFKRETDFLGIEDPKQLSEQAKKFIQDFIDDPKSVPAETRNTFLNDVVNLGGDLTKWTKPGDSPPAEDPPEEAQGATPPAAPEDPLPPADSTPEETEQGEEGKDTTAPAEGQPGASAPQDTNTDATAPPATDPATTAPQDNTTDTTAPPAADPNATASQDTSAGTTTPAAEDPGPGGTYGSGSTNPQGGQQEAPSDAGGDYYYSGLVNTEGGGHTEGYYYQKDGVWYNGDTGEVVTDEATIGSLEFMKAHPGASQEQAPSSGGAPPAGEAEGEAPDDEGEGEPDDDDDDEEDDDDDEEEEEEEEEDDGDAEEDDDDDAGDDGDAGEAGTPNPDDFGSSAFDRLRFWETPLGAEERKREQDAIEQRKGGGFTDPPDEERGGSPFTLDPRSGLVGVGLGKQPGGGVTDPPDESAGSTVVTAYDLENLKMWSSGGPAGDPPEDAPNKGPQPAIDPHAPIPPIPIGGPGTMGDVSDSDSALVGSGEQASEGSTDTAASDDQVSDSATEAENDASSTETESDGSSSESEGSGGSYDAVGSGGVQSAVSAVSFDSVDLNANLEIDVDEVEDVGHS